MQDKYGRFAGRVRAAGAPATLLLAAAGLYATMAFLVGRRTREIGVRVALGARAAHVRQLVMRDAGRVTAPGIAIGLALSIWVGRALAAVLYGVEPLDFVSLSAAIAMLVATALAAAWIPARRAASVDPVVAPRE